MTGSRLRAAPFLCPPLPLSPGRPPPTPTLHRPILPAGPQPRGASRTRPSQPPPLLPPFPLRALSPRSTTRACPSRSPPHHHPLLPAGPQPRDASRTDLSRPRFVGTPPPGEASTLWRFPHRPLPAPPLRRLIPLARVSPRSTTRTRPSQPPPLRHPFPRRAPFPKHHPRLPLQPPPSTAPSSRRGPNPVAPSAPASPGPCLSGLSSLGGDHPPKFYFASCPSHSTLPAVKNRLGGPPFGASRPHPGVFGLFPGFFGYFLGFSGCFLKKLGQKLPFFPASGIIKPLTGTARR